jgi:hypothetical protein
VADFAAAPGAALRYLQTGGRAESALGPPRGKRMIAAESGHPLVQVRNDSVIPALLQTRGQGFGEAPEDGFHDRWFASLGTANR